MKTTSAPSTLVIFKKSQGEVLAIFPELPGTNDPYTMTCYAHAGQHSSCDTVFVSNAKPAKPEEYEPLLRELKAIGYENIRIVRKQLDKYTRTRRDILAN